MLVRLALFAVVLAASLSAQMIVKSTPGKTVIGTSTADDVLCVDSGGRPVACDTVSARYASSRLFVPNLTVQPGTDSTTCVQFLDQDGGVPIFNIDCTNERVGIGTASPSTILTIEPTVNGDSLRVNESDGSGLVAINLISFNGGGQMGFYAGGVLDILVNALGPTVFNEGGFPGHDFRVESDTNDHMLFVDAGVNFIGIGEANPDQALDVNGTIKGKDTANVVGAETVTLPTGNLFHITGTVSVTTLNTCDAANNNVEVTLIFDDVLTFTNGNNLKLAGDFVTTADDVIQLMCDGTSWYEVSRSVN